jgi:hypothetical protein
VLLRKAAHSGVYAFAFTSVRGSSLQQRDDGTVVLFMFTLHAVTSVSVTRKTIKRPFRATRVMRQKCVRRKHVSILSMCQQQP